MDYFYSKKYLDEGLLAHPLFEPMIDYLVKNRSQEIILRELKKEFPQKKFEHFLDQMIEAGLIMRKNRRYHLSFPVFEEGECQEDIERLKEQMIQELSDYTQEERKLALSETIWSNCFEEETDYFYATAFPVETIKKVTAGNEDYQFVTLQLGNTEQVSLPNYFDLQKKQSMMPEAFSPIVQLIGDVNEEYFFDQVEVILERILKHKFKERRRNVFLDVLLSTNVIKKENEYQLVLPVMDAQAHSDIFFDRLDHLAPSERVYVKEQAFRSVMKYFDIRNYNYIKMIHNC
ncbi:hypothetical protein A5844_000325 [Enterococcus sp. 10A9_DIV0425]|uniref:DUF1803 domain-containing protein n=1 Tax=Candidatus Enterococcus wittei TaxID=1987383 RepID=A0A2C9XPM5_9ENTE|nr:DUF1803 domain-containing protein [Enterococcus sp. 10A9_DIV0425]OTP12109.1 hypothetical protein A5844_000325 [Enterococcus sp. 10A9_DIV0425]THE16085.1 DUF1803 domain-containing protein [Enterococcus hirae]